MAAEERYLVVSREEKEAIMDAEYTYLKKVFAKLPDKKKKVADRLIREAAFIKAVLIEARTDIMSNGITEEYKNGENQYGTKKSSAVDVYDKYVDKYMRVYKQLADMLPEDKQAEAVRAGEALKGFLANK